MFGIGAGELVLILIAGLIIFGPGELPKIGRAVGKGLREFKKAQATLSATFDEVSAESVEKSSPTEKVSIEKKSVEVEKVSVEKKISVAEEKNISAEKNSEVADEKNIPAIENLSAEENPPHSALTVDDVINLAKQNPINKENLNEKNFTDTAVVATADSNPSNVTTRGNSDGTGK